MFVFQSILLAIVEGLTEFFARSSTGHMIIASSLMAYEDPFTKTFTVAIQLGAILSRSGVVLDSASSSLFPSITNCLSLSSRQLS